MQSLGLLSRRLRQRWDTGRAPRNLPDAPIPSGPADLATWLDRIVIGGVVLLLVSTPLAIGSVLPWAFGLAEAVVFLMVVAWMAKLTLVPEVESPLGRSDLRELLAPLLLFLLLGFFQLIPLPPALTHLLSPSTYRLYAKALPGWPDKPPYHDLMSQPLPKNGGYITRVLPTQKEVREGAPIPSTRSAEERGRAAGGEVVQASRWLPLSIAPPLTGGMLLKSIAYSCLFALVLLYPFGRARQDEAEKRFGRIVLGTILATGLLVASIAILERAWWNGKILWVYLPYDWGGKAIELTGSRRARGPFVSPDHLGSYLNMILPLAAAGMLFRTFLARHKQRESLRATCAIIAFVIISGLLLSLSRAGWIGAFVGMSALLWLSSFLAPERRPAILRLSRRAASALCAAGLVAVLGASWMFVGKSGRTDTVARVHETLGQNPAFQVRLQIWKNSLPMVRDFPLLGIGLGCFQDLIPHYQSPPWPLRSIGATHDDYLQLLIEAGVAGLALMAWFFAGIGRRLYRGLRSTPSEVLPVVAALIAGMSAMAFQELVDFNLQVPANTILFVIVLAIALRLISVFPYQSGSDLPDWWKGRVFTRSVSAAAILLAAVAMLQEKVPYPYNLNPPATAAGALDLVLEHPALSATQVWMADALGERLTSAQRVQRIAVAVWLDPTNPYVRDAYAQSLLWDGQQAQAMAEMTQSVSASPWTETHSYLSPRLIPFLSPAARSAIEKGFEKAVAHNVGGAIWPAGAFYDAERSYTKEAELFTYAAGIASDRGTRAQLLLGAGIDYSAANEGKKAEAAFRQSASLVPVDSRPYEYLATHVFAQRKDLASARAVVNEGINKGADPFALYLALADASDACGDQAGAESALKKALDEEPYDFEAVWRLAALYARENRYDQAALWMRKATEIRPDSADVFYQLALVEQAGYHYFEASRDFQEAVRLAPQDEEIRSRYDKFERQMAARSAAGSNGAASSSAGSGDPVPNDPGSSGAGPNAAASSAAATPSAP